MEITISPKNIPNLCRICLTSSKNLTSLSSPIDEKLPEVSERWNILKLLETVTFHKITIDDKKFPSKICQMCLSLLRISYEFQTQFITSQNILKKITKQEPTEEITVLENESTLETIAAVDEAPAPVELIFGNNKFDLNDVVVIEEEENEEVSYEGFLSNLGTEVSAKFVNENFNSKSEQTVENNVTIEPLNQKSPTIVIEEDDFQIDNTTTIVKTLYECKKCKSLFESKDELETHLEICYQTPSQFICDKCGHIAHSQSSLYHHMQNHKGKRFPCDKCHKKYVTTSRLKVHMEVHKNERPYLCNVCGKNFNYSVALKYHMRLHTGEKKYVCNYCGLKYTMANTLKRHIRTHTKDKPYICDYCDKRFCSGGEKKAHEMLHTGDTPYQCEYCGKGYAKTCNLQVHYLTHSGPHECHICSKTFIDVKFLRIHLKRFHKLDDFNQECILDL